MINGTRKEIRLRVSFFSALCYNNPVCVTGKQVQLLYEPVAVRHVLYFFLPEAPQLPGQAIGNFREGEKSNAESKYPDRNTPPKLYTASAGETGEIQFIRRKDMQRKTRNTLLARILCMMLIVAMALFTVGCKKDERSNPKSGQETKVTAPAENKQDDVSGEDAEGSGDAVQAEAAASDVTVLGEGKSAFNFTVADKDGNESKFEIHTDKTTVGEALLDLGLIDGDAGDYGLYVKKVNGIIADYDTDKTYWAFYIGGEYAMSGVDKTPITEGESYAFKVEK